MASRRRSSESRKTNHCPLAKPGGFICGQYHLRRPVRSVRERRALLPSSHRRRILLFSPCSFPGRFDAHATIFAILFRAECTVLTSLEPLACRWFSGYKTGRSRDASSCFVLRVTCRDPSEGENRLPCPCPDGKFRVTSGRGPDTHPAPWDCSTIPCRRRTW